MYACAGQKKKQWRRAAQARAGSFASISEVVWMAGTSARWLHEETGAAEGSDSTETVEGLAWMDASAVSQSSCARCLLFDIESVLEIGDSASDCSRYVATHCTPSPRSSLLDRVDG
jgi:hypothetical protein